MSFKTVLPNNYLLEVDDDIVRLFQPTDASNYYGYGKYRYYLSREVIDFEVQWLRIDHIVVSEDIQKYISSLVKNMAFV